MNRRNFLKLLSASVPIAASNPTYFFAPTGGWYPARYLGIDWGFEPSRGILTLTDSQGIIHVASTGPFTLQSRLNLSINLLDRYFRDHRI